MKKIAKAVLCALMLSSCSKPILIGSVNQISTRNIDTAQGYQLLKRYAGSGDKELVKNLSPTLEGAVENVVKAVPGGEYMMNVKVYKSNNKYTAEGDVWGVPNRNDIRGFRVGDKVVFKYFYDVEHGEITALIDGQKCFVKFKDKKGKIWEKEVAYDKLSKE